MKKQTSATSPAAYVSALPQWQQGTVKKLRAAVKRAGDLEETIKWGHLVYRAHGPVLLIRAEERRVLFGFWRGKRLRDLEPRLKPGGKYEMATWELHETDQVKAAIIEQLVRRAMDLNQQLGDPTARTPNPTKEG